MPLQKGAIFCTVNGLAEVRFQMPKELRFTAKVKSNDRDEKALAGYIMNRVVGSNAVFTFRLDNKPQTCCLYSHNLVIRGCIVYKVTSSAPTYGREVSTVKHYTLCVLSCWAWHNEWGKKTQQLNPVL